MKPMPKVTPRRPPSGAAKAFVSGEPTKEAPKPSIEDKGKVTRRGNVRERGRTGEVVAQMTVYLPPDLEKKLRIEAVKREVRPSDLITEALKQFFGG